MTPPKPLTPRSQRTIELGPFTAVIPTSFGPRVLALQHMNGPEIFVSLPDELTLNAGGTREFRFRGGHRLWAAPEDPEITYAPDDGECQVFPTDSQVTVTGPIDQAGLSKRIDLTVQWDELVVNHTLTNLGSRSVRIAPWAISQLPLGGSAICPVGSRSAHAFQADRSVVLWPYTSLSDPRLTWHRAAVIVAARPGDPLKIGSGPEPGRLGYFNGGVLFTKTVPPDQGGDYCDRAAVAQVYCNEHFCELETLGPLTELTPGDEVSHQETWSVVNCDDLSTALELVVTGP